MSGFIHLHVHSQYSILDGASNISQLIDKAKEFQMPAIAITDHGNMFGAKEFYDYANKAKIKPIIGCETYLATNTRFDKSGEEDRSGYHLILLAKNHTGYRNLIKLVSYSWTEGFYYKPRIDRELLYKYHEGLIATTACIAGEIPQLILAGHKKQAEEKILELKEVFGDDFYLEVQRHITGDPHFDDDLLLNQQLVIDAYKEFSVKLGVKIIATNDSHFINKEDAEAHDRLLCLNTGKDLDDPNRLRYSKQEYFKSAEEMAELFSDIPEAISNTLEITEKVESFVLDQKPILPDFPLPEEYSNPDEYLRYLTYKGAKERYPEVTEEIKERIEFELEVVKNMGFAGYFLIVQDFIQAARDMDVSVGPGRGSAGGSIIAYCNRIIDINPLAYDLLFERFLNPDRISMPDIDIDFDEDGRERVIKWVINKYGGNKVAQVITFGTMAAKMAIRDVARVQKLPLSEADKLAKLVPEKPGITLKEAYNEVKELSDARKSPNELISETLKYAETLEGSVRHTGLHACAVIISRDDLTDHVPICKSKDSDLLVTQYDGKFIESVGMLKMDFLGLKTLSIIRDTIENIKLSKGVNIVLEEIPFDDPKTFELFTNGDTGGIFQFESEGMRKHLRELKPNQFEDLIAMTALYRPGPMAYIPDYIRRKHGKEKISYDHPTMEKYLSKTYGITVYQEQVMQLSRAMAGFTRGQADSLRKAMGKKNQAIMAEMKRLFVEGCEKNDINEKIAEKVWTDWEAFAHYAFNKSHAACYSFTSYRMAYLKAHYPAEFYAAVLSRNLSNIKEITFYIDECNKHNILVLGPDINESETRFTVNKNGEIRFGLAAIKGVGEAAVDNIISERNSKGLFSNIFDFAKRINLRTINKRNFEALVCAGAFDSFEGSHRAQYFHTANNEDSTFIEKLIKHVGILNNQQASMQSSLFGDSEQIHVHDPEIPDCNKWSKPEQLQREKDVIGFYISGHPLDEYKIELLNFTNITINSLKSNMEKLKNIDKILGGMIISASHKLTKNGKPFGSFTISDYTDSITLHLFSENYLKFKHLLNEGEFLRITCRIVEKFHSEELEYKVLKMELLSEAITNYTNKITLLLNLENLDENLGNQLESFMKNNPGKCPVSFKLIDNNGGITLNMRSKKYRVNSNDFVRCISSIKQLQYKLN